MDITVNQKTYSVADVCSLQQIISVVLHSPFSGIAVAINQKIISKNDWESHFLESGDHIIIIKAAQGG
ncbi:sulfur carrier protein ThiS [Arcticibacter eurypsychrophilus]|uniref:sulfur carrier protein ThiS n=1 Tax=Arcticibacter eurypsychrophilus TaxID=1434752 RepID=UPI00084DF560|nr:sulfur carrier protein ThiS [Arcticibacter eurypsychrophilus]